MDLLNCFKADGTALAAEEKFISIGAYCEAQCEAGKDKVVCGSFGDWKPETKSCGE